MMFACTTSDNLCRHIILIEKSHLKSPGKTEVLSLIFFIKPNHPTFSI